MFPQLFTIPEFHLFGFTIPEFTLYTYGLLLSVAFGAGIFFAMTLAKQRGIDPNRILDLGLVVLVSSVIGARLFYVATAWDEFSGDPMRIITQRFGFVYYGGMLTAILAGYIYLRIVKLDAWNAADILAPPIALGQAIGRLGCFAQGCCFGHPTDLPWSVEFPHGSPPDYLYHSLPVHPTQLYESGLTFVLFALLMSLLGRRAFKGQVFAAYMGGYGVIRFLLEFLRGDFRGTDWLGLSVSQWISLGLVALSVFVYVRLMKDPNQRLEEAKTEKTSGGK